MIRGPPQPHPPCRSQDGTGWCQRPRLGLPASTRPRGSLLRPMSCATAPVRTHTSAAIPAGFAPAGSQPEAKRHAKQGRVGNCMEEVHAGSLHLADHALAGSPSPTWVRGALDCPAGPRCPAPHDHWNGRHHDPSLCRQAWKIGRHAGAGLADNKVSR